MKYLQMSPLCTSIMADDDCNVSLLLWQTSAECFMPVSNTELLSAHTLIRLSDKNTL